MPPHVQELKLENQLCFALYDASRAFTRAYAPLLNELGLTYPQYLVMLVLWESNESLSVGALGRQLHLDSGTLTPLLKRLEQRGLVARTREPRDERRVLISLTVDGEQLRSRAANVPNQIYERCGVTRKAGLALLDELSQISQTLRLTESAPSSDNDPASL